MTAWTRFSEAQPRGAGPWLVRAAPGALPRFAVRAPGLPGYRLTFPAFEPPPDRLLGQYAEVDELGSWSWAEIPE